MPRALGLMGVAAALCVATPALAREGEAPAAKAPAEPREHPDLGIVRYHDPLRARAVHLGFDVGGVVLPARLGLFDRTVWTVRGGPAWAIRLAPWMSLGGRHGITLYDASSIRVRAHDHQLEAAFHPMVQAGVRRVHDRLLLGVETHAVLESVVDGTRFRLGGVRDVVGVLGYGVEHRVAERWALGWQASFRHAWVFRDTQRQLRAAVRAAFEPRPGHRLALEATGFFVDRNRGQAGADVARRSVHGQLAGEYGWMSKRGVGPVVRMRYASGFFSGEAPIYELRGESLRASYGDITVGLRARWR